MAEIHAILARKVEESPFNFRRRCGDFLLYSEFPGATTGASVARMNLDGEELKSPMEWGAAHEGPLPADVCIIASLTAEESRVPVMMTEANYAQLDSAPKNPGLYPRLAQRMSYRDFYRDAVLKKLENQSSGWEVFLDGASCGFCDGGQEAALLQAHSRAVNNALYGCTPDAPAHQASILPSQAALLSHRDMERKFPREFKMANARISWNARYSQSAMVQGWDVFHIGGELQVQKFDEAGVLDTDLEAWLLVAQGQDEHHVVARTVLASDSPFEWTRIKRAVSAAMTEQEAQKVSRESEGG